MTSILFIHRSVGRNLLNDGRVYKLVRKQGKFSLSDYDQNTDNLTDFDGRQQKLGFVFPGGNTRPADLAAIFNEGMPEQFRPIRDLALSYDVIVAKSCYPNSNIKSDGELETIKAYYQNICDFFATQPEKSLVIMTSPPLTPILTRSDRARRARQLANWLTTNQFADNIHIFDFFDLLTNPETDHQPNVLKKVYRHWLPFDAHPNARASQEIAPQFIEFLTEVCAT